MAASEPTDEALLERIGAGDKQALRTFYERHHDALYGFIRTRLSDEFEAADIVHDVMMDVWRTADRFQGRSSPRTWLFTIGRNRAIDHIRRHARVELTDDPTDQLEATELEDETAPESLVSLAEASDKVAACLDKLSESHRTVLQLAFFDDMPYREIAAVEAVAEGTVKTRIFHAKKLLLRCLQRTHLT